MVAQPFQALTPAPARRQFQSAHPLTDEQYAVVYAAVVRQDPVLVIKARAGTGKTQVLETIASNTDRHGLYVVFNTRNKAEAENRMPPNITTRTMHGLAFAAMDVKRVYGEKLFKKINYREKYRILGIEKGIISTRNPYRTLQDIEGTVRQFCQSADREILEKHLPKWPDTVFLSDAEQVEIKNFKDQHTDFAKRQLAILADRVADRRRQYSAAVLEKARKYWALVIDPAYIDLAISHDHYLKAWHLSGPVLNYDFVMADELQDSNALTIDVITKQTCQRIAVGDGEQQIYGWRGATNALEAFQRIAGCRTLYLTKSFRFGQAVADIANAVLYTKASHLKPVVGFEKRHSTVGPVDTGKPYTIVTRSNAAIFQVAVEMAASGWQQKLHVVGGLSDTVEFIESGYWLREKRLAKKIDPEVFKHDGIRQFETWTELEDAAKTDRGLAKLIETLEKYGDQTPAIIDSLKGKRSSPAKSADVIVTTAHKAKGLEFEQVVLCADFPIPNDPKRPMPPEVQAEELNILYVAATRALGRLQVNSAVHACLKAQRTGDSLELVEEIMEEEAEDLAPEPEPEPARPPHPPARVDAQGLPFAPCACGGRHFLLAAEGWLCSACALPDLGPDDPLPVGVDSCSLPPPAGPRLVPPFGRTGGRSERTAGPNPTQPVCEAAAGLPRL